MTIEVVVTHQLDGTTFSLTPESRAIVSKKSRMPLVAQVFVGHETKQDFETFYGSIWGHIGLVVTSLTESEIRELGGIVFKKNSGERLKVCYGDD